MTRNEETLKAIIDMREGAYKATGFKFELEAQFNRLTKEPVRIPHPEGEICFRVTCDNCDGEGNIYDEYDDYDECGDCDGTGISECDGCRPEFDFRREYDCHQFLLKEIAHTGMSEKRGDTWYAKFPLVFSKFYNDHSVDSEWTFTISSEDPEAVMKEPEFTKAFKRLGAAIDNGFDVAGAGMHTAVLQGENAHYPDRNYTDDDVTCYSNFRKSMNLLLPALYFLATSNEISRGLRFRMPRISTSMSYSGEKYSAIYYNGRAMEYRLFDTCYDDPEHIYDNLIVIRNTLKFWNKRRINNGFERNKSVSFGSDENNELARFYKTYDHLELLNKGLARLKPSYTTIKELKQQRKFGITKRTIKQNEEKVLLNIDLEYKEYCERYDWSEKVRSLSWESYLLERHEDTLRPMGETERRSWLLERIKANLKSDIGEKHNLDQFKTQKLERYQQTLRGDMTLTN